MKKYVVLVALVLATSLVSAQGAKKGGMASAGKAQSMMAEFVSADMAAKTITVKDDKGQTSTLKLAGKTAATVGKLKPGDKLTLMVRNNDAVVGIKSSGMAKGTMAKATPKKK